MITRPLSIFKIQKIAAAIFLVCVAVFSFLFYAVLGFNWIISVADSVITNALLALCCIVFSMLLGYYQPKNEPIFFVFVLTFVKALFVTFSSRFILNILIEDADYTDFLQFTLPFRFIVVFIFLAWSALANILWYRLEEQSEMQERLFAAQNLAKEAELNKLRHQLQPHFLFNSLNSVYALTLIKPKEAGTMIAKLASFLRGTLKRDDDGWISVAEEMKYIQLYLDIEKVRFNHRLNVDIKVDDRALDLCLPGTLLQPVVENAIKFGLYNTSTAILISIVVEIQHNALLVTVQNPYDPEMNTIDGTGFGLTSVRRRLYLLFADHTLLQTRSADQNLFITTLKIPQKNDKDHTH